MSTVLSNKSETSQTKHASRQPRVNIDTTHVSPSQNMLHVPMEGYHGRGMFKSPISPTCRKSFNDLPSDIESVHVDNLSEFISEYKENHANEFFIIDTRPFNDYSQNHITDSINLCVPSTLLKRASYSLDHMLRSIDNQIRWQLLDPETTSYILIYDCDSVRHQISFSVYQTCLKFHNYDRCNKRFKVFFVDGGISNYRDKTFQTDMSSNSSSPQRTSSSTVSFENISPVSPNSLNFSGFALPSSTPSQQKLLSSIKRNALPKLDLTGISGKRTKETSDENLHNYNYKLRIPDLTNKVDKLPKWLKFFAEESQNDSEGRNKHILQIINSKFNKIERTEQARLRKAISSNTPPVHSPNLCSPGSLCPGCDQIIYKIPKGIEFGFKNRYNNIWPYEHARVKLSQPSPSASSPMCLHDDQDDYFNASYINFKAISNFEYIATQNPLQATYEDFWRTIWVNKVDIIICLNKQHENFGQSLRYFDDQKFEDFQIGTINTSDMHHFILREIDLVRTNGQSKNRKIYHLEFKDWPDFGVPGSFEAILSLISFKNQLIQDFGLSKRSLVHCSAGCGRTGCFITLDMILDSFKGFSISRTEIDPWGDTDLIYRSVQIQRKQRISMVQTLDQFIVCYEIVLHYIVNNLL